MQRTRQIVYRPRHPLVCGKAVFAGSKPYRRNSGFLTFIVHRQEPTLHRRHRGRPVRRVARLIPSVAAWPMPQLRAESYRSSTRIFQRACGSAWAFGLGLSVVNFRAFECDAHFRTTTVVNSVVNLRRTGPIRAALRAYVLVKWVELRGFEPLTPTLPVWCATNCAIAPFVVPHEVTPRLPAIQNRWSGNLSTGLGPQCSGRSVLSGGPSARLGSEDPAHRGNEQDDPADHEGPGERQVLRDQPDQ